MLVTLNAQQLSSRTCPGSVLIIWIDVHSDRVLSLSGEVLPVAVTVGDVHSGKNLKTRCFGCSWPSADLEEYHLFLCMITGGAPRSASNEDIPISTLAAEHFPSCESCSAVRVRSAEYRTVLIPPSTLSRCQRLVVLGVAKLLPEGMNSPCEARKTKHHTRSK